MQASSVAPRQHLSAGLPCIDARNRIIIFVTLHTRFLVSLAIHPQDGRKRVQRHLVAGTPDPQRTVPQLGADKPPFPSKSLVTEPCLCFIDS
jgi:hypothetical protein